MLVVDSLIESVISSTHLSRFSRIIYSFFIRLLSPYPLLRDLIVRGDHMLVVISSEHCHVTFLCSCTPEYGFLFIVILANRSSKCFLIIDRFAAVRIIGFVCIEWTQFVRPLYKHF